MQQAHRLQLGRRSIRSLLPTCLALAALGWAGTGKAADALIAEATPLSSRIAALLQREGFELPVTAEADGDATTPAVTEAFAPASKDARTPPIPGSQRMAYPTQQHAAGLIVRFRDPENQLAAEAGAALATLRTLGTPTQYQRAMSGGMHVLRFNTPLDAEQAEAAADAVRELGEVEWAVPDLIARPEAISADPHYARQWGMHAPGGDKVGGIDAESAWDISTGSPEVVVAVVDTGIRPHPEFGDRILPGYDFISDPVRANDGNGRDADARDAGDNVRAGECEAGSPAEDNSWHGTQVAGIIAADGANGVGIAGVAWNTRILPVRALGKCGGVASDVLDGIRWAIGMAVPGVPRNPHPARIINLSLSVFYPYGCYPPYREVLAEARARGVLIVAAAGNSATSTSSYSPANCSQTLSVMAGAPDGELSSYSNYGRSGVLAPGGDFRRFGTQGGILSTFDTGTRAPGSPAYAYGQGTSLAAPHVAGIAALAQAAVPRLSGAELHSVLQFGVEPFAPGSYCAISGLCGSGHANAPRAIAAAAALSKYALVREFYNTLTGHFFRTGSVSESASVNNGRAGPGWTEIDNRFYAWNGAANGTVPVCRFYGTPGRGPNSHFYTANAGECAAVKQDPTWTYEGTAFHVKPAIGATCPADTIPVYRAYNQRWQFNDSNHRYTTDRVIYESMATNGWSLEGIAWCAAA